MKLSKLKPKKKPLLPSLRLFKLSWRKLKAVLLQPLKKLLRPIKKLLRKKEMKLKKRRNLKK